MVSLIDLPEEILIIIIRKLDTKAAYNLYNTCERMKNIILMKGVIRVCNLSVSTLATAKSLKLEMFNHVLGNLHELNMCGVPDLTKSLLLPAIKKMKCLKTLNVAYTNINMVDVIDLYKNCKTIKNIAINLHFPFTKIINEFTGILLQCREVFKNFENVHFVLKSWFSILPLHILKKSSLDTLTFTVCDWGPDAYNRENIDAMFPSSHLSIFLLNWRHIHHVYPGTYNHFLPFLEFGDVEFIIIEYHKGYSINTTPLFRKFFSELFTDNTFAELELDKTMEGNIAILIWNKETTVFDGSFYSTLHHRMKQILACELEVKKEVPLSVPIGPDVYDWFRINHFLPEFKLSRADDAEPVLKKVRTAPSSEVLNYDNILYYQKNLNLTILFTNPGIVTLSSSSEYLRKLTYLSLRDSDGKYSNEFFNVLFRCCDRLTTLNVEASVVYPCCSSVLRSIPLSQSIKNIRLVDKRIDFNMLFSSFSQCKTLENICVVDVSKDLNHLADPITLFQKCNNLYSLFIKAVLGSKTKKLQQMLNTSKKKSLKHHLNLVLNNSDEVQTYDPYVHVFNLGPIQPA